MKLHNWAQLHFRFGGGQRGYKMYDVCCKVQAASRRPTQKFGPRFDKSRAGAYWRYLFLLAGDIFVPVRRAVVAD